ADEPLVPEHDLQDLAYPDLAALDDRGAGHLVLGVGSHRSDDLGDSEEPDHHGDETDAPHQVDVPEGAAGVARGHVDSDGRDQDATADGYEALYVGSLGDDRAHRKAQDAQPEVLEVGELEGEPGQGRGYRDEEEDADESP